MDEGGWSDQQAIGAPTLKQQKQHASS